MWMLLGFVVGMVMLSSVQQPAIDMAIAPTAGSIGAQVGSLGAFARNAQVLPTGFANQQPQQLTGFNFRGLHNTASGTAFAPTIARAGFGASSSAYTRPMVVRADSSLLEKLEAAIQSAKDCKGTAKECQVEWDNVEELSAQVSHQNERPRALKGGSLEMSKEDMDSFQAAMAKFAEARKKVPAEIVDNKIDEKVMAEIAAALQEKQDTVSKVSKDRLDAFEKKIQEAIATATASKSPVDWDIVEELMQERSHLKRFGGSS